MSKISSGIILNAIVQYHYLLLIHELFENVLIELIDAYLKVYS